MARGKPVIGKLAIKVFPDLSTFKADLKAQLSRIDEKVEVKVNLKVDDTGLKASVIESTRSAKADADKIAKVEFKADLDSQAILLESNLLAHKLSQQVTIPLKVDVKYPNLHALAAFARAGAPTVPIKFDIDNASWRKAMLELKFKSKLNAVEVPVKADSKGFLKSMASGVATAASSVAEIGAGVGKVFTEGFSAASKQASTLSEGIDQMGSKFSNLGQIASIVAGALTIFGYTVLIGLIGPAIGAVTVAIGALEGALLVLPAAGFAAGAGLGALLLALHGVSSTLQDGLKGAKNYSNELRKLAPSAQTFVKSIVGMKDQFKGLREQVQESFFSGFANDIQSLGQKYIPVLKNGLVGMGGALGTAAGKITEFLSKSTTVNNIKGIFDGATKAVNHLSDAFPFLLDGLTRLGSDAMPALADLGDIVRDLALDFDNWVKSAEKSGELDGIFANLKKTIETLLEPAEKLAAGIAKVFSTKETGDALDKLKGNLNQIVDNILPVLPQFIDDLGKMSDALEKLSEAAPYLADMLSAVTDFVAFTVGGLWPSMALMVDGLIEAFKTLNGAAGLVQDKVGEAFLNMPAQMTAIGMGIVQWVSDGIGDNLDLAKAAGTAISSKVKEGMANMPQTTYAVAASAVKAVGDATSDNIGLASAAGTAILNAVKTNVWPLAAQLLAFGLSLPGKIGSGIVTAIGQAALGGARIFSAIYGAVVPLAGRLLAVGLSLPGKIGSGILSRIGSAAAAGARIFSAIYDAVAGLPGVLYSIGASIINGLINGIKSRINSVKDTLSGLTSLIPSWKGPPSKDKVLLYGAGQLIMKGLVHGISDGASDLRAELQGVTQMITTAGGSAALNSTIMHEIQGSAFSSTTTVNLVADGQKIATVVANGSKKNARRRTRVSR